MPIGSVVTVKDSQLPLMITCQFPVAKVNGKEYPFNYNTGLFYIIESHSKDNYSSKEYVNQTSDMFSAYEKGKVTYED